MVHRMVDVARIRVGIITAAVLILAACAPTTTPSGARPDANSAPAAAAQPAVPSRVTIAVGVDPTVMATKLEQGGTFTAEYHFIPNSPLAVLDPTGQAHPLLASELPSQDRGTWAVNPDGTMTTTWKIRPNAVWHDGQPVTARDFVFALKVYQDDGIRTRDRYPERFMDRIEPKDDKTFVIYWRQTFAEADQLNHGQLEPLPEHLVGQLYENSGENKNAFSNAPFWTSTDYVGAGPYRLTDWEHGSHLVFRAFDQYFMGRPSIDEVVIRVFQDVNAIVAAVLAGEVDVTAGTTLTQPGRIAIQQVWDQTGEGKVVASPTHQRMHFLQFEPSRNKQPALFDVRVRRALAAGMDRAEIASVVSEGTAPISDVLMSPNDPNFARVNQVITKYPFDRTQALAWLQEAGWTRRGDTLVNDRGEPLTLEVSGSAQVDNATEMNLVEANLRELGLQANQFVVPQARAAETEFRVQFAGLSLSGLTLDVPGQMAAYATIDCPTAENRFIGLNRGCYSNAEFDRLFQTATTTLNKQERSDAIVDGLRIATEQVVHIPMGYHNENIAVRKGLVGPAGRWPPQRGTTWNIREWRWTS